MILGSRIQVLREIFQDLFNHKLLIFLFILNFATALLIVQTTFSTRALIIQQDALIQARDEYEIEWRHLILEQRTLAEHSRVEGIATKQLDMKRPDPSEEVIITY